MTCNRSRLQCGVHVYKRVYEELFRAANESQESIVLRREITRGVAVLVNQFSFFYVLSSYSGLLL